MSESYIREYYEKIEDGTIVVGKWVRKLYQKIIGGVDDGTYLFDESKANNAIEWIESHTFHTEGALAPHEFKMELWQKAIVQIIFGICDPKSKKRQFREVVLVMSRKNGKTLFASAIAKYCWYVDGGFGARIYCLAPKLDQADLVYNSIWQMTILDKDWQELKAMIENSRDGAHGKRLMDDGDLARHTQSNLQIPSTNSQVKKIAFSAKKSDGFNPSLVVCDEIASWRGDSGLKQYEVMKSGMGAREMGDNPSILLSCSTSGYENEGIYDELIKRATMFLNGQSKERKLLPILYMIDDIEKWNDIEELKKSNPNLDVSVPTEYLLEEIAIAENSLSKKAEFITKYCNLKQNSSQAWLNVEDVDKCFNQELSLEEFRNSYCVGGIDLSQTTDLTACCVLIEKNGKLYHFNQFFMPSNKLEEAVQRDGVPYQIYVQKGWLTLTGENYVDYSACFDWFRKLVEEYQIYPLQVGYDRYSSQYLVQDMEQYGFHMDDVYQGENLTPVIKELEGVIKDGEIEFGNNDLMKMHLLNSAMKINNETNRQKLIKVGKFERIDGTASLLDAMCVRQKWHSEIGESLKN